MHSDYPSHSFYLIMCGTKFVFLIYPSALDKRKQLFKHEMFFWIKVYALWKPGVEELNFEISKMGRTISQERTSDLLKFCLIMYSEIY